MPSIMALMLGVGSASAQFNVDHLTSPYSANPVLKSVVDIGNNHAISVGTIERSVGGVSHKDILLTKTNANGNIVWNKRYGQSDQNENGHAVTLGWDGQHVIVVGSMSHITAATNAAIPVRDAITLKIRISDGALIWTTTHGTISGDEEALIVERTNFLSSGLPGTQSYIVAGRSSGSKNQPSSRLYAFRLTESGGEVWSKRYLLKGGSPLQFVEPSSMVSNGPGKFVIAGVQTEVNRPDRLFTTGINAGNGNVSDDYMTYAITSVNRLKRCAIAREPDGSGFGLAFTAENFSANCFLAHGDHVPSSVDRIGILRLFSNRSVKSTVMYWDPEAENQGGLALQISGNTYNVATTYEFNQGFVDRPGFLRVNKSTGAIISNHIFYSSALNTAGVQANTMIPISGGNYLLKSFIAPNNGFALTKVNSLGVSDCDESTRIVRCAATSVPAGLKSTAVNYGSPALNYSPRTDVSYFSQACADPFGARPKSSLKEIIGSGAKVYPSPVSDRNAVLTIEFDADQAYQQAKLIISNAMGQKVMVQALVVVEGANKTSVNTHALKPGMYTFNIVAKDQVIERSKFLKQ